MSFQRPRSCYQMWRRMRICIHRLYRGLLQYKLPGWLWKSSERLYLRHEVLSVLMDDTFNYLTKYHIIQIVHVTSIVLLVAMTARTRFVSVVKIHRLRTKVICNNARKQEVLIWVNASLIAMMTKRVNNRVLISSKIDTASARVRYKIKKLKKDLGRPQFGKVILDYFSEWLSIGMPMWCLRLSARQKINFSINEISLMVPTMNRC